MMLGFRVASPETNFRQIFVLEFQLGDVLHSNKLFFESCSSFFQNKFLIGQTHPAHFSQHVDILPYK